MLNCAKTLKFINVNCRLLSLVQVIILYVSIAAAGFCRVFVTLFTLEKENEETELTSFRHQSLHTEKTDACSCCRYNLFIKT